MIEVACRSCGKKFELADKWAGKTFKCPKCAKPVRVSAEPSEDAPKPTEPVAETTNDDSQLNWDLISSSAESMAGKTTLGAEPKGRESLIEPLPQRAGGKGNDASPSLLPSLPIKRQRRKTGGTTRSSGNGVGGGALGDSLAQVLLFGGVLSVLALPVMNWIVVPETRSQWPLELVRLVFGSIALVMVVVPITGIGMKLASRAMKFQLPDDTGYRLLAWMLTPSFFMAVGGLIAWQTGGAPQYPSGVLAGGVAGLLFMFFTLWWMFSLGIGQAIVSFLSSFVFMVLGVLLGGVMVGAIALVLSPLLLPLMGDPPQQEEPTQSHALRDGSRSGPPPIDRVDRYEPPPPSKPEPEDYFDRALYRLSHARSTKRYDGAKMIADVDRQNDRAEEVINALLAQMHDTESRVQQKVFEALCIWDRSNRLDYARELVGTRDRELRRMVIDVFVEHGDKQAIPLYAKQLRDRTSDTAAKDALIGYGLDAQPHVLPYLDDTSSSVRRVMLEVIYAVGDAEAAEHVIPLIVDRNSDVSSIAKKTIRRIAPDRFDRVDEALLILDQSRFTSDRTEAYKLLADTQPESNDPRLPRVAEYLEKVFDGHSIGTRDRDAVMKAIGHWHRRETVSKLLTHIDEEYDSSTRRNNAIEALGEIGDPRAIKPIINWISKESTLVSNTLVKFGQAAEPPLIVAIYQIKSESGLLAAVDVLDEVGTTQSLTHLYKLSRSAKYQSVRLAAGMAHKTKLEQKRADQERERQRTEP